MADRRNRYTVAFKGWVLLSLAWIWFAGRCPPRFYANENELVNYSDVLTRHARNTSLLNSPQLAFVIAIVVGFVLLWRAGNWRLGLLLLALIPCTCLILVGGEVCIGTTLRHADSVEFDGSAYHLTLGDDTLDWSMYSQFLILHECEQNRERCRGRTLLAGSQRAFDEASFVVDENLNELLIVSGSQVLFRLDADVAPTEE